MRRAYFLIFLLIPCLAWGYQDHRGRDLDSLEQVAARFTPDRLAAASAEEKDAYVHTCRELAWGLINLDGTKTEYYARQAIQAARADDFDTVYDLSILIGQCFWGQERYDSARVHYMRAQDSMLALEAQGDTLNMDAMKARLWGTLGNFYAMQDSLDQCIVWWHAHLPDVAVVQQYRRADEGRECLPPVVTRERMVCLRLPVGILYPAACL